MLVVMVVTAGVYAASNFEVTPSAIIGFLTILSYSLYDTVVVFDKIRENTADITKSVRRTFGEEVNLAVNQTLVRSINTMMVAVLPVASILFIGAFLLGAGTLRDLSLALFIGIIVSTFSTIFVAAPMYSWLREREPELAKQAKKVHSASRQRGQRRRQERQRLQQPVLSDSRGRMRKHPAPAVLLVKVCPVRALHWINAPQWERAAANAREVMR